jgi:predicted Zn finger-like uncharacterized protein
MILTCPECATRFKIADDAIGPNGRTVRCSQCTTTWFVAAEPDVLNLDDAEKNTEIREEIIREPVPDSDSVFDNLESGSEDVLAGIGAHAAIRETADRKKARRRLLGVSMIWVVTLVILAVFALAAFLLRAKIVEIFPGTAPIYKAIGLEANASGLEIYDIETRYGNNEGVQVLYVNGRVKNFDVKTRDVELIRLSFKNATGEVLSSWVVEPSQSVLKPGQAIKFSSQFPNPPVDAVKLAPEFVTETGMSDATPMASQ